MNRRHFLWTATALTGSLVVGATLGPPVRKLAARLMPAAPFGPGGWIEVTPQGAVHLFSTITEMGQGSWTCLAQIVCEELEADYSQVKVQMAPAWRSYDELIGFNTGGSDSTRRLFKCMRDVAARARVMLISAAANRWKVAGEDCVAKNGVVTHTPSGRSLRFGELAHEAARQCIAENVPLKPREHWHLIGQSIPRVDSPEKVDGRAEYGIDFRLPGMLVAAIAQAPSADTPRQHFDATAAKTMRGVISVVDLGDLVAVVAKDYWTAQRGLRAAAPQWAPSTIDSRELREQLRTAVNEMSQFSGADVDAIYECPALLHAQLEPLNATARVSRLSAELWVPTQAQDEMKTRVAEALGLWAHTVTVHTALVGGGFGRRLSVDYGVAAARIAREFDVPIKCIWSREADSSQARPRPMSAARFAATLDNGRIRSLEVSIAGLGKNERLGSLREMPYAGFTLKVGYAGIESGIVPGSWRSVDSSQNVFYRECFLDECALAIHADPMEFRRTLLANDTRALAVLERVADLTKWVDAKAQGRYLGCAYSNGFGSQCAQVVEVVRTSGGKLRVAKVWAVVDCGIAINPDIVRTQIEGGVMFGLSAALFEELTWEKGILQQDNYDEYRVLRITEAPDIVVEIIESPTAEIGGIGEVGVPPLAPALVNALFAATGTRARRLPLRSSGLPLEYV
jgi:isoquinoline 1-oxidoreductase beta subunit